MKWTEEKAHHAPHLLTIQKYSTLKRNLIFSQKWLIWYKSYPMTCASPQRVQFFTPLPLHVHTIQKMPIIRVLDCMCGRTYGCLCVHLSFFLQVWMSQRKRAIWEAILRHRSFNCNKTCVLNITPKSWCCFVIQWIQIYPRFSQHFLKIILVNFRFPLL